MVGSLPPALICPARPSAALQPAIPTRRARHGAGTRGSLRPVPLHIRAWAGAPPVTLSRVPPGPRRRNGLGSPRPHPRPDIDSSQAPHTTTHPVKSVGSHTRSIGPGSPRSRGRDPSGAILEWIMPRTLARAHRHWPGYTLSHFIRARTAHGGPLAPTVGPPAQALGPPGSVPPDLAPTLSPHGPAGSGPRPTRLRPT